METTEKLTTMAWFKYGLLGALLGLCVIALSAAGLFAAQIANPPPTPTLIPTPTIAAQALLDQAEEALYTEEGPQFVLDTLGPHLEEFSNPEDQARALEYMAIAEMYLGHFQLSAAYLERLCQISPEPGNYAFLARMYDSSGDLKHALANYLIYLESDDPELTEEVRQLIEERVDQIQSILTSFTPTPEA